MVRRCTQPCGALSPAPLRTAFTVFSFPCRFPGRRQPPQDTLGGTVAENWYLPGEIAAVPTCALHAPVAHAKVGKKADARAHARP